MERIEELWVVCGLYTENMELRYWLVHVLSFTTLRKYWDPSDPMSLIISPVPQPMTSTAELALFAHKKQYISKAGRQLDNQFREHLRDVQKDIKNASKPVVRHFKSPPPNHPKQHMAVCSLPYIKETRKAAKL